MKLQKLTSRIKQWVANAIGVSRTLARRTKRKLGDAWVAHVRLMRANPHYRQSFAEAAKDAADRVVAAVPSQFGIPARAFATAVSLHLAAMQPV